MADSREPPDEEAAQRADENRAHEIAERHAPPFARGDFAPANENKPLTPEEKRELFARHFPSPPAQERDRDAGASLFDFAVSLTRAHALGYGVELAPAKPTPQQSDNLSQDQPPSNTPELPERAAGTQKQGIQPSQNSEIANSRPDRAPEGRELANSDDKRELFARYFPTQEPDRSRDRDRDPDR